MKIRTRAVSPLKNGRPIALYWFIYFTGLGVFFPYYALYLRENAGLSGTEVGIVMASIRLVALVAQPFWGNFADRTGARPAVLAVLTLATALSQIGLLWADGFVQLLAATCAMSVFASAVLPISFSVAFALLRDSGPHSFGLARVWGTVGFLIGVAAFPPLLDRFQREGAVPAPNGAGEAGLEAIFVVFAVISVVAAASCVLLPRRGAMEARAEAGDWRELWTNPAMVRLLIVSFLAYLFLHGPIEMFPLFVTSRGGNLDTIGRMWVVMLVLEIPLVALAGAGMQRLGARALLMIGIAAGGIRWLVCVATTDTFIIYAVQSLHGVVVTGLLLGGPLYLEKIVPERLRSTAQSALATVGVGAGGLLSSVITGWLIDRVGIDVAFFAGGAGGLVLGLSLRRLLPRV